MKSLILFTTLLAAVAAAAQVPAARTLTRGQMEAAIDSCSRAVREHYVFADVAERMAARWAEGLAGGRYDGAGDFALFCQQLQEDGRAESHDLHFGVRPGLGPVEGRGEGDGADDRERRGHYGWRRLEVLPGNVGYLELDGFSGDGRSGPVAAAGLQFLAGVDALVIDLRNNGGGDPKMIQLISSYLLPPETHLNSFHVRKGDQWQQFWTLPWVPGATLRDVPVYVLTSGRTFSAGEEFCYNLRNLGRATLVGERTGGGAHPVASHEVDLGDGAWLEIHIPFGRAVNPISGTNWEGTGVEPHLNVPAAQALDRALLDWYDKAASDPATGGWAAWARVAVRARLEPVRLDPTQAKAYGGSYGPRKVRWEKGSLTYRRDGGPEMTLTPLDVDLFATEVEEFRVRFERDATGRVSAIVGLYGNGREDRNPRD